MARFEERLYTARTLSGFSLQGLSDAIGRSVSKQSLSMYESGIIKPRYRNLTVIAEALGVSTDYFSRDSNVMDVPMLRTCISHDITDEEVEYLQDMILFYADRFGQKLCKLKQDSVFFCPLRGESISSIEEASDFADNLRRDWSCGDGTIPSILRLMEMHGIWVFDSILPDGILGISTWVDGTKPLVVLDTRESKTTVERLRFTAAHELAHLLFSIPEGVDAEKMCNRFASYFLLPKNTLIQELGERRDKLYLEELIDLHEYYGVSIASIVHEAYDFGIINREYYDEWYDTRINNNKREIGWGIYHFPETLGREKRMDVILGQNLDSSIISFDVPK